MYYIEEQERFFLLFNNPKVEERLVEKNPDYDLTYGVLLYNSIEKDMKTSHFPFYSSKIRSLKTEEVVKYKLLGYI